MRFVWVEGGLEGLRAKVKDGHTEFAILLNGGAYSRKTIRLRGRKWNVKNHIDDTRQVLDDTGLWSESHIGEALDKEALVEVVYD